MIATQPVAIRDALLRDPSAYAPVWEGASRSRWTSVLVLLDGSEISHWTVPRARHLLEQPGISVTLLRVIACTEERAKGVAYRMDSRHWEAVETLSVVRNQLLPRSVAATAKLRFGDPVREILREISEGPHDLVVMSTHGRTGLNRVLFGTVAGQVLEASPVPLLLFRPMLGPQEGLSPAETSEAARFERILVPLDGLELTEEILPVAEGMARALGSELYLFRAIPGGRREAAERLAAEEHLTRLTRTLALLGIKSQMHIRSGDFGAGALALIRERDLDSVALMTQSRSWLRRAIYGSVAERMMREAGVPILTLCDLRHRLRASTSALKHRPVRVG